MRRIAFSWSLFVVLASVPASAGVSPAACGDWFQHLAKDHNVWLLKEQIPPIRNSSFQYLAVPKTNLVLALPLDQALSWKAKIASDGSRVDVSNGGFGYVIDLKNGDCANTSGYGREPGGATSINYDWKICEDLIATFRERRADLDAAESSFPSTKTTSIDERFANMRKRSEATTQALQKMIRNLPKAEQTNWERRLRANDQLRDYKVASEIGKSYTLCVAQTGLLNELRSQTSGFASPAVRK